MRIPVFCFDLYHLTRFNCRVITLNYKFAVCSRQRIIDLETSFYLFPSVLVDFHLFRLFGILLVEVFLTIHKPIHTTLPLLNLAIFIHYVFVHETWMFGRDGLLRLPNMSFRPFKMAHCLLPFSKLGNRSHNTNALPKLCMIF